jgi:parvulin-like peptidyl-prolyl isomerase
MFSMQMMSRPGRVATELPGLHYPSDELRNATFELKEGEVTVAPNQPHDIYYVVLLNKRESASREDFARSRQFIEMQIQSEQQEKMYRDWLADLRREASGKLARVPAGN